MNTATKVDIGTRLLEEEIIKTPEEWLNFMKDPYSEQSLTHIYELFLKDTKEKLKDD